MSLNLKENKQGNARYTRRIKDLYSLCELCAVFSPRALRLFSLFVCMGFLTFAQKTKKDSITHFKVKYITGDYKFTPADGYLFVGSKNKLKITNSRNSKFEVKVTNGKISKTNDSLFVIENLVNMGVTLVSIFEKDAKGKKKLVVNKPFTVVSFPQARFSGVACDSAMPALSLAAGTMSIYYKSTRQKVPVNGFKMEFYENDKFILDSSNNNRLSKKMLAYVEKLKPGSLVYLSEIKYNDPNGNPHIEPVYRVFIIKEGQIKFGLNN